MKWSVASGSGQQSSGPCSVPGKADATYFFSEDCANVPWSNRLVLLIALFGGGCGKESTAKLIEDLKAPKALTRVTGGALVAAATGGSGPDRSRADRRP